MEKKESWHLDRRVPIALILTLSMQTAMGVWWGATMSWRMDNAEKRIEEIVAGRNGTTIAVERNTRDVAVLASELKALTNQLERLYAQGEATNQLLRQLLTGGGK